VSAVDALIHLLDSRPTVDGATVAGWRLQVVEGQSLRAGVRCSRLGGPYVGPGVANQQSGSLELHWSDGLLTRAGLDRQAVCDPASELAAWRAEAVTERSGRLPPLAGPTVLPEVQVFDPSIADAVATGAKTGLSWLRQLTDGVTATGIRRVDAVARIGVSVRTVATSHGFRADWRETSCSLDLWADELAEASYGRRCLPSQDDLARLVDQVTALAPKLAMDQTMPMKARGVLFMPSVVQELVGRLLLPNLAGRAIRDGRSPFSRADLDAARSIVRSDIDLVLDTTLPFALATAPCSSEGVPAGRARLIAGGRLVSPMLDLEMAGEFGLPPTPAARGGAAAVLTSTLPVLECDDARAALGDGVVVRDLPGLHTQQPRRSTYALVAPDAQAVVSGVAGGRCAVRLAGNLLSHLTQPSMRLVKVPGDPRAGLLVVGDVELLPA
jgi:hypothetical protein